MVNVEDVSDSSAGTNIELGILHSVYDWLILFSVREYFTHVRMSQSPSGWKLQNWDRERRFNFVPHLLWHVTSALLLEMDFTALVLSIRPSVRNQDFLIFFSGITEDSRFSFGVQPHLVVLCQGPMPSLLTSHLYNIFFLFTDLVYFWHIFIHELLMSATWYFVCSLG